MCGAGMSGRPTSTLGFERIANPYLRADLDEAQFVAQILGRVPPFPAYYRRMKVLNAKGAPALNGLPGRAALTLAQFDAAVRAGQLVIDLRDQVSFGDGHVPGSFGIGAGANLSTWASWVVPYDTPLVLVAARPEDVEDAIRSLIRVGLDDVRGFVGDALHGWIASGRPIAMTPQLTPLELSGQLARNGPVVIDVRSAEEWDSGHIAGARHIMAGELADRVNDVPSSGDVALVCGSGYRSTVSASVLERAGRSNIASVTGGMTAWKAAGLSIVRD
jgi:hydroxyacylglutathione hydrolase